MRVGVPKEIKTHEYRVGLIPASVRELVHNGHEVFVEHNAGYGVGFDDEDYERVGATVLKSAQEVFDRAEMVVKVKEPQASEIAMLREDQVLFTYLHLAPDPDQTKGLMNAGCTAIAYETVTNDHGGLPLLAPMSEVAGRMAIQAGAHHLEKESGGAGILLAGVPGVPSGKVVILGGGVAGTNAARMAMGMEARVTIIEKSIDKLHDLDQRYGGQLNTIFSTVDAIEEHVSDADLVVGAVLVPGGAAPKLVTREMLRAMPRGGVFVDVSIDQGGCAETSRPTTHDKPTYIEEEVIHYCVANMPGGVARTAARALNNATLPFVVALANKGWKQALTDDRHLRMGLNVHAGKVTYKAVADDLGLPYTAAETILGI